MNKELRNFIKMSKYAGCRCDIVQAGGGNTSVKCDDGTMLVKASGVYLSEVSENYGYAQVKNDTILEILKSPIEISDKKERDKYASNIVNQANLSPKFRPSIETLLHSMLGKYILHSHPIVVNSITCRENWRDVLTKIFEDTKICLVNYKTPGIELAEELHKVYNDSKIIFLQNHGLIVTSGDVNEVLDLTEMVLSKIEQFLDVDMNKYKLTSEIYKKYCSIDEINQVPYLCNDEDIYQYSNYFYSQPFCPDKMVYCGYKAILLNDEDDILQYKTQYFDMPKVIIYKNKLFFMADNVKKAKEIEDVFKFHVLSLFSYKNGKINYLSDDEICYLSNWEAEKYRQNI